MAAGVIARELLAVSGLGTVVDFIPHVPGPNRRPAGQRAWLAHARHGCDSVNDAAFRLLVA